MTKHQSGFEKKNRGGGNTCKSLKVAGSLKHFREMYERKLLTNYTYTSNRGTDLKIKKNTY